MDEKGATAIDHVCGRTVPRDTQFTVDFMGDTYYFCSGRDLAEFERDPLKYVPLEKAEAARAGIYVVKK